MLVAGTQVTRRDAVVALPRTVAIPFRVVHPDQDQDASGIAGAVRSDAGRAPIAVLPDGTVPENPTKQEHRRWPSAWWQRQPPLQPYDVVIVGAGPAGLATAGLCRIGGPRRPLVLEALVGGQAGASARIELLLGFPTTFGSGSNGTRAFTQAQKFGAEFSLPLR